MNTRKITAENAQPGDLNKTQLVEEMIRVNHAGEYGAKRIYAGQIAVLKDSPIYETIKHMYEQELVHLEYFAEEIGKRKVRPTALIPIWHVAAFALGAVTAKIGEKAAMACTVAVEEVIDEHYKEQLEQLGDDEKELKEKIAKFREEELEHREIGIQNKAEEAPGYMLLKGGIKFLTKFAINVSKKV